MKQQDKDLLLRDISARLPYGLKFKVDNTIPPIPSAEDYRLGQVHDLLTATGLDIEENCIFTKETGMDCVLKILKPYLRPISSLTDEEIDRLFDILKIPKDGGGTSWIKINDCLGIKFILPEGTWIEDLAEIYDYLNSIHADYRGMIEKGLAIEVTDENNPYK